MSRGVYLPVLSPEEEQQGAQLLRETAEAFELLARSEPDGRGRMIQLSLSASND